MRIFILCWRGHVLATSTTRDELETKARIHNGLAGPALPGDWSWQDGHGPMWSWGVYSIQETTLAPPTPAGWTIQEANGKVWIHRTFEHEDGVGQARAQHWADRLSLDHPEITPIVPVPLYLLPEVSS